MSGPGDVPRDRAWMVMDARAADDEHEATVFEVGTCAECCAAVNAGEYGPDCLVGSPEWSVAWHLLVDGRWEPGEA